VTSLVDRYVFTALRRVPEPQRADIDRELRASIQDAIEARTEAGEPHDTAVENTLLDLGDPDRLADQYADRSNFLIGPELFPIWRRMMVMLFSTVLPLVLAIVVVIQLIDDPGIGKVIGTGVSTLITVSAHLAFWTTLGFAIIERTGVGKAELRTTWALKDLPKYEPGAMSMSQLCAFLVWSALLITALVLQQFTFSAEPVLDPANWSFWWPFLIVVTAARGGWAIWVHRTAGWTRPAAVANAVLAALFAAPVIWLLATDAFFNPAFGGFLNTGSADPKQWVTVALIASISLTALWDIADVTVRVERVRRGLPTKVMGTGNSYTLS
jgi:hypothetical protein